MHWQAIQQSRRSLESMVHPDHAEPDLELFYLSEDTEADADGEDILPVPLGHDNAADVKSHYSLARVRQFDKIDIPSSSGHGECTSGEHYTQVAIPTFTTGITTFAYQLALQNRIKDATLREGGEYDTHKFTPTFIHDCLMLPGSLAGLLRKSSTPDLIHKMTPALLPGFHAHVHAEKLQPCILQSPDPSDYVSGMLIFGQGKDSRKLINEHYRSDARRIKLQVEVDVQVPVLAHERDFPSERWRLKRRRVEAHVWLWANARTGDAYLRTHAPKWTLEDYLAGTLAPRAPLKVLDSSLLHEEVDLSDDEREQARPQHETIDGGYGNLDYQIEYRFTGW
ncbi:hypothetical protein BAUCODRAFT_31761 [Baudoinia panamericana UAMH 10762]|uniref:Uncharacterized protein n=1 Tax=Baudoinia panamericana (strain UAMH 10762) TaxID=717646 RepID=M2MM55_BAUPA|nr:uncharacterized protein BAUCODRAFT_31761 [Baudoinia panamericana UAMH 10762]EMC97766.1 hypothetical protein BAUCODRAFT_31761 [Baudoinia panamericana UAMH 10762]